MSLARFTKIAGPLLAALLSVSASAAPGAVLVFIDDESQLTITDATGKALTVSEGLAVAVGATLHTKQTTAELRLAPNGSILKLAPNTTFRIQSLQDLGGQVNSFALDLGRIRVVAAKLTGSVSFTVSTPIAQAGVRGTDFVVEANPNIGDWICVKEGVVEFAQTKAAANKSIQVRAGEFANAKAADFKAKTATPDDIATRFAGLDFIKVKEADVPGHTAP